MGGADRALVGIQVSLCIDLPSIISCDAAHFIKDGVLSSKGEGTAMSKTLLCACCLPARMCAHTLQRALQGE